jgi:hypothetical protein
MRMQKKLLKKSVYLFMVYLNSSMPDYNVEAMGEKNSTGVEYILLNAKRRKRHYFEREEISTCHIIILRGG